MRSKGFTLIELLAVIVILAIIALIAAPVILNIIKDAQRNSDKESVKLYLNAVTKTITNQNMKSEYNPNICTIVNGDIVCQKNGEDIYVEGANKTLKIGVDGKTPSEGALFFSNGIIVLGEDILYNEFYYTVINGEITNISKTKSNELDKVLARIQVSAGNYSGTCVIQDETTMMCGGNRKVLAQTEHNATEGIIVLFSGKISSYRNIKINDTYYHQKTNGEKSQTADKQYICTRVSDSDSSGTVTKGDKYTCVVKSDMQTPYTFYVLTDPKSTGEVNLIMDRHVCNDGGITYTSANRYCRYAWYASAKDNTYGPITAMTELYNGTKNWDNVPAMEFSYKDESESNRGVSDRGYTSLVISNGVATITGKPTSKVATIGTSSTPVRARLPMYSEVNANGCRYNYNTCPEWLVEHMKYATSGDYQPYSYSINNVNETYREKVSGYWLLSTYGGEYENSSDEALKTNLRVVHFTGIVGNYASNFAGEDERGITIRPVITVLTDDLN